MADRTCEAACRPAPSSVSGVFRQVFGVGLREVLTQCRLAQAEHLLITSGLSVLDVALESGFGRSSGERHRQQPS